MKKIIYGMLILIGGVLIASNFNVDSSKLDHKTVSASGTVCKWISESGYGVGPYYIDEDYIVDKEDGLFGIFNCNNNISGEEMDGMLLYKNDKSLVNGEFSINGSGDDSSSTYKFNVTNGKVDSYKVSSSGDSTRTYEYSGEIFNNIYMIPHVKRITAYDFGEFRVEYQYDVNEDGKNTFTCVCAEY